MNPMQYLADYVMLTVFILAFLLVMAIISPLIIYDNLEVIL